MSYIDEFISVVMTNRKDGYIFTLTSANGVEIISVFHQGLMV